MRVQVYIKSPAVHRAHRARRLCRWQMDVFLKLIALNRRQRHGSRIDNLLRLRWTSAVSGTFQEQSLSLSMDLSHEDPQNEDGLGSASTIETVHCPMTDEICRSSQPDGRDNVQS